MRAWSKRERPWDMVVIGLIVIFALFFSLLALRQHRAFLTHALDIGNVDQALWNTAQGRFLHFTLMTPVDNRLALHVEPLLLLLLPAYWLGLGSPALLLVTQAAVVALGAWPLYRIGLNNFRSGPKQSQSRTVTPALVSSGFSLAYLLLPTLESAVLFDFHAVTLAPTFLLFAFLALIRRKNRQFALFAGLAAACKEDMPLVVAMLGLYGGLSQGRWRLAGWTVGLSGLWFWLALVWIQPHFAAGGNIQLGRYAWLGDDLSQMMLTLTTRPGLVVEHLWREVDIVNYLGYLFFPTAFLALLSPLTLLPMLPTLAINLLSDNPFTWRLEDFHYGAPLAPFLFISAIYGLRQLQRWLDRAARLSSFAAPHLTLLLTCCLLIFSGIYHYHRGYTPLARSFRWPPVMAHHQRLETILATVPVQASLFAQSNLAPHVSQRRILYSDFAYFTDPAFRAAVEPVSDVVLDLTTLENIGGLHQFLDRTLLQSGHYRLLTAQDGILHLRSDPGAPASPALPASFYTFIRPQTPPDYPLRVDFGAFVRLHGYSLHFNRQEEIQVTLDLEPLRPLTDRLLLLYLLDAAGHPLGATVDLPPALVWYPVERWPVGAVTRVRFNTLPWHARSLSAYRLGMGVIEGGDPWAPARRLPPRVERAGSLALRLPANGTLLELAQIEQPWKMPWGGPPLRRFSPPSLPERLTVDFDDQVRLLGYALERPDRVETELSLKLAWQALRSPEPLVRFVHLVGPDGRLYGQNDAVPDRGLYPLPQWQPGEVVVEQVTLLLTPERPPGLYNLHLGFYRPDSGERLFLQNGNDHLQIPLPE